MEQGRSGRRTGARSMRRARSWSAVGGRRWKSGRYEKGRNSRFCACSRLVFVRTYSIYLSPSLSNYVVVAVSDLINASWQIHLSPLLPLSSLHLSFSTPRVRKKRRNYAYVLSYCDPALHPHRHLTLQHIQKRLPIPRRLWVFLPTNSSSRRLIHQLRHV
jgi:hypothetical protein